MSVDASLPDIHEKSVIRASYCHEGSRPHPPYTRQGSSPNTHGRFSVHPATEVATSNALPESTICQPASNFHSCVYILMTTTSGR